MRPAVREGKIDGYAPAQTDGRPRGRYYGQRTGEGQHPGADRLAGIREAELRKAAAVLGGRETSLLDYWDQKLDRAEAREAVGTVNGGRARETDFFEGIDR